MIEMMLLEVVMMKMTHPYLQSPQPDFGAITVSLLKLSQEIQNISWAGTTEKKNQKTKSLYCESFANLEELSSSRWSSKIWINI